VPAPKLWRRGLNELNPAKLTSAGIAVLLLVPVACGPPKPQGASPSPTSPPATYESLRQRPVTLPTVTSAGLCPVSRPVSASKMPKGSFVPFGFGEGPVYLSSHGMGWYSDQTVSLIVDPAYSDIVLVRGKQLDGPQGMPLVAAPASPASDIQIPAGRSPQGREWDGRIAVSGPGCFGLQVDGATFEEGIVFEVEPGAAPPPGPA
jgi:hypothetical protein